MYNSRNKQKATNITRKQKVYSLFRAFFLSFFLPAADSTELFPTGLFFPAPLALSPTGSVLGLEELEGLAWISVIMRARLE